MLDSQSLFMAGTSDFSYVSICSGPVQEGDYGPSGTVGSGVRLEAGAVHKVVLLRPVDGLLIPPVSADLQGAVQEGEDLSRGQGSGRGEVGRVHALCDMVLYCPEDGLVVVFVGGDVHEGIPQAGRLRAALGPPEEGDALTPGHGQIRSEVGSVYAIGHLGLGVVSPEDGHVAIVSLSDVDEGVLPHPGDGLQELAIYPADLPAAFDFEPTIFDVQQSDLVPCIQVGHLSFAGDGMEADAVLSGLVGGNRHGDVAGSGKGQEPRIQLVGVVAGGEAHVGDFHGFSIDVGEGADHVLREEPVAGPRGDHKVVGLAGLEDIAVAESGIELFGEDPFGPELVNARRGGEGRQIVLHGLSRLGILEARESHSENRIGGRRHQDGQVLYISGGGNALHVFLELFQGEETGFGRAGAVDPAV